MTNWSVGKSVICDISNDNCWIISFAAKGFFEEDNGKPYLKISFLKWCGKIKQIFGHIKLITCIGNDKTEDAEFFSVDHRQSCIISGLLNNPFDTQEQIEYILRIMVTKVIDCDDNVMTFPQNGQLEFK
eukprot:510104_1